MYVTPHILVVEDDREISALVARYLRANDCRVAVAADGYQHKDVEVVVTDHGLGLDKWANVDRSVGQLRDALDQIGIVAAENVASHA